jgi:hypothetical protein
MTLNARRMEALVMQMQDEFLESPTLRLTLPQAERRFGIDRVTCDAVLSTLVDATVLARTSEGAFVRFFPRRTFDEAHAA